MTSNLHKTVLYVIVMFALCLGCAKHDESVQPQIDPQTLFSMAVPYLPETLDPAFASDPSNLTLLSGLYEGLTTLDSETLAPLPGAAERWEISDDGLTYTFHLRKATMSDGRPISSTDFLYSWNRILLPTTRSPYAELLYEIKNAREFHTGKLNDFAEVGISGIDQMTLAVTLDRPCPYFLQLMALPPMAPVARERIMRYGAAWCEPGKFASNGPFIIHRIQPKQFVVLRKNPSYWDASSVKLLYVQVGVAPGLRSILRPYFQGGIDLIADIPATDIPLVKDRSDFYKHPHVGTFYLSLNTATPVLADSRVRRALGLALEKDKILSNILVAGQPAGTLVPIGVSGYDPPVAEHHDVDSARKLLEEAGYPQGKQFPKLRLLHNEHPLVTATAESIQKAWKDNLGIEAQLRAASGTALSTAEAQHQFDVSMSSWIGNHPDPMGLLALFRTTSTKNPTGWTDSHYDELLEKADSAANTDERSALLREAEDMLLKAYSVVPLLHYSKAYMLSPRVGGFTANTLDIHPLKNIFIKPDAPQLEPPSAKLIQTLTGQEQPMEPKSESQGETGDKP